MSMIFGDFWKRDPVMRQLVGYLYTYIGISVQTKYSFWKTATCIHITTY